MKAHTNRVMCPKCGNMRPKVLGICGYNGVCDGLLISEESNSSPALAWWESLTPRGRQIALQGTDYLLSSPKAVADLSLLDIEEIYKTELKMRSGKKPVPVPDSFDPEQFAYSINNLTMEERIDAIKVLFWSLDTKYKSHVLEIGLDRI